MQPTKKSPYEVKFIGESHEIPLEQHYKLSCTENGMIIFASSEDEAIELFLEAMECQKNN